VRSKPNVFFVLFCGRCVPQRRDGLSFVRRV
jgi:hypothetical protein